MIRIDQGPPKPVLPFPSTNGFQVCHRQEPREEKNKSKILVYMGKIDAIDALWVRKTDVDEYCVKTS